MEGGITFKKDGTFTKAISIYAEEKKGTYTINSEAKTITFKFDDDTKVEAKYEVSGGKIINFSGKFAGNYLVTFAK